MNINEINEITLAALTEKRARIAALRERLDGWLTCFDGLRQTIEILLNQRIAVTEAESDLLEDPRLLLREWESDSERIFNQTLNETIVEPAIISLKYDEKDAALSFQADRKIIADNQQFISNKDQTAKQFIKPDAPVEDSTDNPTSSVVIEPNAFLEMTQFKALKSYFTLCGIKRTLPEILTDLPRGGFHSQAEYIEQNFRSMLRYYTGKGVFERTGESWGLPDSRIVQENAVAAPGTAPSPASAVKFSDGQTVATSGGLKIDAKNQQLSVAPKAKILSLVKARPTGRNRNCNYPPNELTTAQYCQEILQKSGQPWLHVDQILVIMERDYAVKRRKVIVASALRKNAKAGRFFKSFGDNRFGLLEMKGGEVKASA